MSTQPLSLSLFLKPSLHKALISSSQESEEERWEGLLAVRKTTQTKELGLRKKTISSSLTSKLTVKVVGVLFLDPPVFNVAEKAVVSDGLTISDLISRGVTSPSKKMISSSNYIAFSVTSGLLLRRDYQEEQITRLRITGTHMLRGSY
jgi:hypothetical protein